MATYGVMPKLAYFPRHEKNRKLLEPHRNKIWPRAWSEIDVEILSRVKNNFKIIISGNNDSLRSGFTTFLGYTISF